MRCSHQKSNGDNCKSQSIRTGRFCWLHDPSVPQEAKRKAQARGGSNNAVKTLISLPPLLGATPKAILEMLVTTINEVRAGEIDIRVANCVGFLSGHLVRIYEISEMEERLAGLERDVAERLTAKDSHTP